MAEALMRLECLGLRADRNKMPERSSFALRCERVRSAYLRVKSFSIHREGSFMRATRQFKAATAVLVLLFLLRAPSLSAAPPDQLGKVNLPTTCSGDVQPTLEKGLALLHSFQYKESEQTFTEAATRAPKCAMTHWGKAMALYHQLWDFPQEDLLKEGRKYVEQARKARSGDPR